MIARGFTITMECVILTSFSIEKIIKLQMLFNKKTYRGKIMYERFKRITVYPEENRCYCDFSLT